MSIVESLHRALEVLPVLARFAVMMALIVVIPRLARRVRLPEAVGLLLGGVVLGPQVLDVFPREHPVAEFFSELGMLLLMFFAGLEINLTLFRQKMSRSIAFGVATTSIPLLLGTLAAHWLGYGLLPAIVVGSLLASHTLLASTIVRKLGVSQLEPIVVTIGATMMSDTLSLLVFAVCVPLYASGFSAGVLPFRSLRSSCLSPSYCSVWALAVHTF
jgi:Kef-type K+ transport system membrane component KefB